MADPTYLTLSERIEAEGITLPLKVERYTWHGLERARILDAVDRELCGGLSYDVAELFARALNAAATPANVANLIREAVLAEREACGWDAYERLKPFGERPPCECVRHISDEPGSWVAVCGSCTDTRRLVTAQHWCSRQNAAEEVAAAIRARGERESER